MFLKDSTIINNKMMPILTSPMAQMGFEPMTLCLLGQSAL